MDKNSAMYWMSAYDIIYDTVLLEQELATRKKLYQDYELFDGDDGYASFLTKKVEEYEQLCDEYYFSKENYGKFTTYDAMSDFVAKNIDKWIRQLKGIKHCKVKVVLEVELDASTGCNMPMVEELVKSNLIYDIDHALEYENASVKILNVVGKEVDE